MKKLFLLTAAFIFATIAWTQTISLSSGIAADANNPGKSFYFIPIGLQWQPFSTTPLSLVFDYDIGLGSHATADAYTLAPSLPPHLEIGESIKNKILTLGISLNVKLFEATTEDQVNLTLMPLAYCWQRFRATYKNYDQEYYEILNQDVHRNSSGLVMACGLQYLFKSNTFIACNIQSPLLKARERDFNYKYAAPARVMFGYQFTYKRAE